MKTISFKYIILICFALVQCAKMHAQSSLKDLLNNGASWGHHEDFIKIDDDNNGGYAGILFNTSNFKTYSGSEDNYHMGFDPYILVEKTFEQDQGKIDHFGSVSSLLKFRMGYYGGTEANLKVVRDYYKGVGNSLEDRFGRTCKTTESSYQDFFSFDIRTGYTTLGQLGNVGIGTTTPQCKLDVGTDNASSTSLLLDVHGSAHFNNDLGTSDATMTKVSINTDTYVPGCALTVAGPTYIGDWRTIESGNINADYINTYNLWVDKGVVSPEFRIANASEWADDVFEPEYNLPTLKEVEQYVSENGHLHGVPSAKEVKENGYSVGKFNSILLRKVEELTVYVIAMERRANSLQEQLNELDILKAELKELKAGLQK